MPSQVLRLIAHIRGDLFEAPPPTPAPATATAIATATATASAQVVPGPSARGGGGGAAAAAASAPAGGAGEATATGGGRGRGGGGGGGGEASLRLRAACAGYLGSYLARAAFVGEPTVRGALFYLLEWRVRGARRAAPSRGRPRGVAELRCAAAAPL